MWPFCFTTVHLRAAERRRVDPPEKPEKFFAMKGTRLSTRSNKRNLKRTSLTSAVLLVIALVVFAASQCGIDLSGSNENSTNTSSTAATSTTSTTSTLQAATVERVVDGDTIIVEVDGQRERVRLIGLDTPESVAPEEYRNTEEGMEASDHTKSILPAGTTVWLEQDVSDVDQYDRLLRYVWLEEPTDSNNEDEVVAKMLNAQLIADGWAVAKDYEPDTKWSELFHSLEA